MKSSRFKEIKARFATKSTDVVVGSSEGTKGHEAFRWTSEGGMVGRGDLAGGEFFSWAYGVSSDGSVVVGFSKGKGHISQNKAIRQACSHHTIV